LISNFVPAGSLHGLEGTEREVEKAGDVTKLISNFVPAGSLHGMEGTEREVEKAGH
ncbi:hypothetical protein J6590_061173, partial [Homalodisca vitripennis]